MATDGTGYLIPDNPQPNELNCLLVFYPDDPMYLAALLGSITYLGTWTAWERDPDKKARLAAAAWKDANECTLDSMSCVTDLVNALTGINQTLAAIQQAIENQQISLDTGDIVTAVNGVQAAIENQQLSLDTGDIVTAVNGVQAAIENLTFDSVISEDDMSIVINNCCCSCGGSTSTTPPIPDEIPPDYTPPAPMPNPDEPDPETESVTADTCAYVHYLLVKWRQTVIAACNGEITLDNVIAKFQQTFSDSSTIINWAIESWPELYTYIGLYLSGVVGYGGVAAAEIDNKFEAIKCACLQMTSIDTKRQQVGVLIDTMSLPQFVRLYAKSVFNLLPLEYIYGGYIDGGGGGIPEWAYAPGCPGCVDTNALPLPSAPVNYKWQVGAMYGYSAGGGVTSVQTGNVMDVTVPAAGADRFIQLRFNNFGAVGVYGIALVAELMPDTFHVRSGGWYTTEFDVTPADDNHYIMFANKGAPVIDWGDYDVFVSNKALVLDVGRFDFLSGGGLYRFSCWELVPA